MKISNSHNFVFIHIHKTGGTSVASALGDIGKDPYGDRHMRAITVWKKMPHRFNKYFKFTFVRNPWDRIVSAYTYDVDYTEVFQKGGKFHGISFPDFLQLRLIDKRKWWAPCQKNWLFAKEKCLVNFIGRFENLQADFDKVCKRVGLKPRKLPHKRKTKRKPYQEYYNKDTRKLVEEHYLPDIKEFGYTFEGVG